MSRFTHARQRGFSIVELMVAMTLSLVLLAGVLSVLYSSRLTYMENERVARIQENARGAMEFLLRDLRTSGYRGCSQGIVVSDFRNALANPTALLNDYRIPVLGFERTGAGAWSPNPVAAGVNAVALDPDSDVIVIRSYRPGSTPGRVQVDMASGTDTLTVEKVAGWSWGVNTRFVVSDCDLISVFMGTGIADAGATATITRGVSAATNSTNDIGRFNRGALVTPVVTAQYFIQDSDPVAGPANYRPSLYRSLNGAAPEELVEGVELLQARYGVDDAGEVTTIDRYVTADAVPDWNRVVAVNLGMLIRSPEETGVETDRATYDVLGTVVGPFNDRRQRTLLTTTITLRNRTK